jgi:hypothetical protein
LIIAIVAFLVLLFVIGIVVIFLFAFGVFAAVTSVINNTGVEIGSYRDEISGYKAHVISSYEEYEKYFKDGKLTVEDFEKNNYYIFSFEYDPCSESDFQINNFTINSSNGVLEELEVGFTYETKCGGCAPEYMYYAIKLDKGIKQVKEFNYTAKARNKSEDCGAVAYKPMIYIYPDKDMNVEVKLGNSNLLTTTYPKYEKSWKVFAKTNGDLEYNGRTYYGLYWEGANHNSKVKDDGFVIKGEDTSKFLEEKLEILGLNEREINEFIIYWLPKMEHNKYNYIRFETREEIDSYMPLSISPSPQSVIRVYMDFKGLDKKIEVKEQQLEKNERVGYSVIEWGGSEIK